MKKRADEVSYYDTAALRETLIKDYEFSKDTMREYRVSALDGIRKSFAHLEWFEIPNREVGFDTHDVHRYEPGGKS
jgi:NTE family protein